MTSIPSLARPALVATSHLRHGLGNRLRFVLSCQAIADAEGREFYYHWPIGERGDQRFGARFDELWEYVGGVPLDGPGPEPRLRSGGHDEALIREHIHEPIISLTGNGIMRGSGDERDWGDILADLRPTTEVISITDRSTSELGGEYIGVQVRAHPTLAPQQTLEASPVSWYIRRMHEHRDINPDIQFFLSCDDADAEAEIIAAVSGVIALRKEGRYNSRQGLTESVADLVILSRSSYILAPYWSSFADLAWRMARKQNTIENSRRVQGPLVRLAQDSE